MAATRKFAPRILEALAGSRYVWIRAGKAHRFIGIWLVVVSGRVFVRSWTLEAQGWYRTFLKDPHGAIRLANRAIRIRAVRPRSERLLGAVDRAYAGKYTSPSSRQYVRGMSRGRRRASTTELVPR